MAGALDGRAGQGRQQPARSSPGLPHPRRFDESWVEVSSQPSSSSLSSIGDEIVTTGLRVGHPYSRRRRVRPSARPPPPQPQPQQQTVVHTAGTSSSQDEYDESDSGSEQDGVLTSSTEKAQPAGQEAEASDDSDDDGDDATALGGASSRPVFRPQPNAFSHPPSAHPHSSFTRPSFSQRSQTTRVQRAGPSFMSPSSACEDNEAALRASLTTLLSCAAAARGLAKTREEAEARQVRGNGVGPSNQPVELRLVPESELTGDAASTQAGPVACAPAQVSRTTSSRSTGGAAADTSKRAVPAGRSPRATKKKKTAVAAAGGDEALMSPTLLTWVVSAGVVVLVSVVGFGAGYVMGREVGRQEALSLSLSASVGGGVNETTQCGRHVMGSSGGGLGRLRWGSAAVGKSIIAQA